jgi:hypothetical protein
LEALAILRYASQKLNKLLNLMKLPAETEKPLQLSYTKLSIKSKQLALLPNKEPMRMCCGGRSDVCVHTPLGVYAQIRNSEEDRTNVQLCFMLTA